MPFRTRITCYYCINRVTVFQSSVLGNMLFHSDTAMATFSMYENLLYLLSDQLLGLVLKQQLLDCQGVSGDSEHSEDYLRSLQAKPN